MTKKEIAFLITIPILVAVFFLIATPSRENWEKKKAKEMKSLYPKGWQDVVDNPEKTIHVSTIVKEKMDEKPWKQEMLDKEFNLDTDFQYYSPEAMSKKLPLLLSSGEIPDYFICQPDFVRKFAAAGFLMEIPYEMLQKYMPNRVELVNKFAPNVWLAIKYDGKNFGVPAVWTGGLTPRTGLWRMDWLKKVGINKVPDTIDEYYDALYKFRHNDPDGNGIKDTYGMTSDLLTYYTFFTEIFGAHGVMPFNWMEKDGKVVWGGVQPETKETLALLHKWYKEGIIHPDFQTDKWWRESNSKFQNGKTGYNNYMCSKEALNPENPSSVYSMMKLLQPGSEIAPGHPPKGPRGDRGHRVWGAASSATVVFGKQMAQKPDKVIRVMKMLDALDSDIDLYVKSKVGEKGKHWDWKDPKVGQGSGIKLLPPYDERYTREKEGFLDPTVFGEDADPDFVKKYQPTETLKFNQEHRNPAWGRPDLFNWNSTVPKSDEHLKDLIHLQQVYFADIITGKRPLSAFDEFAERWHKQGGDVMLEEAQKLYDSRIGILRKLGAEVKK